jgi:hypothetical protein
VQLASLRNEAAQARRIQTATVSVEVTDLAEAERKVALTVDALGGYVQDSRSAGEGAGRATSYVLRVPADRFEEAVEEAKALGVVRGATTQAEDVTEAYADLEMRLRVKRGVEARLRDLLSGRTGKLSEVIEVENELARVIEEVERIETALAGYDRRIAWSTVKLDLRQVVPIVHAGFREKVGRALHGGIASFTAALTGLVYLVAFLAPWLLLGSLLLGLVLRLKARRTRGENMA